MVRKRISLTAQTAGCLPLKCTHLSQFRSCLFVCRCRYCFFFVFQFSPQRTFQAHLSAVIFLSDTVLSFTFQKEIHSKAVSKQDLFIIQIKIHLSWFLFIDKSPIINCKFQSLRRQSYVITLCRDTS